MRLRRMLPVAALALAGCGSFPYTEVPLSAAGPPPVECAEIPAPPETPGQLWIPGRWVPGESDWQWQPGRYVTLACEDDFWVPGAWKKNADTGAWDYLPGDWRPIRLAKVEEPPTAETTEPAVK